MISCHTRRKCWEGNSQTYVGKCAVSNRFTIAKCIKTEFSLGVFLNPCYFCFSQLNKIFNIWSSKPFRFHLQESLSHDGWGSWELKFKTSGEPNMESHHVKQWSTVHSFCVACKITRLRLLLQPWRPHHHGPLQGRFSFHFSLLSPSWNHVVGVKKTRTILWRGRRAPTFQPSPWAEEQVTLLKRRTATTIRVSWHNQWWGQFNNVC